ncbi:MAG: hypothetical protein IJK29_00835 [Bacteroidales bacterium]|nr:hypothetical protein [Bacteroidales bacterium]
MDKYNWTFTSVGGTVRVKITSGADIAHLGELDRKLWTVLSCPAKNLEFDQKTLELIDADHDGNIRVDEVIATAQWLTTVLKDHDLLLTRGTEIPFAAFNEENPEGAKLLASAKQILANLKLEKDSIALEDTADMTKIFADTKFNGDGVITPASADDEKLAALVTTITEKIGKAADRSGADGVTADHIEAFYTALADYATWQAAGTKEVFPFGDKTADALAAVNALKDKVADFFMRCKLIGFDQAIAPAVDVSVDKIGAIEGNLAEAGSAIADEPLAKPAADGILPLDAVNPAWKAAIEGMRALVLDADKKTLTEAEWADICGKFAPYTAWMDAKKGAEVEALGIDEVKALLKADQKEALLKLVEADKALEEEALSIEAVDKLLRLFHNFYDFLNNYVVFADFYDPDRKAIFQAGRLYIDQRSTDLCVRVDGPHPEISSLSGMYILYCACKSEKLGKAMNIAAVLTKGDVDGLRPGKNAVFYDRDGNDWSAVVTSIVENPLSLRQAFWAPYKKAGRWINDKVNKFASDKNAKGEGTLSTITDKATTAPAGAEGATKAGADAAQKAAPFDIARFAGIAAAIGMAVAAVGAILVGIVKGLAALKWWQWIILIAALMLIISLPSVFIAWRKLRRRDLGPVLNANGWAINASSLVSVKYGKGLTEVAKFPKLTAVDPVARRKAAWRKFFFWLIVVLVAAFCFLFFTNRLAKYGVPFHKEKEKPLEEEVVNESREAPAAEPTLEEAAEATAEPAPEA